MSRDEAAYRELFAELENYEKNGVNIFRKILAATPSVFSVLNYYEASENPV